MDTTIGSTNAYKMAEYVLSKDTYTFYLSDAQALVRMAQENDGEIDYQEGMILARTAESATAVDKAQRYLRLYAATAQLPKNGCGCCLPSPRS